MPNSPKKILCIDDARDDCELCSFILTDAGYQVELAQSITSALQLIEASAFSLCLTDISLPDGTGLELMTTVRAVNPTLPFVILSADSNVLTRQQAIQAGAHAFFLKPIDYTLLVETIDHLLQAIDVAAC